VRAISDRGLALDILKPLIPVALAEPTAELGRLLERIGYRPSAEEDVLAAIEPLREQFERDGLSEIDQRNWIMGRLRPIALGNVPLCELASAVEEALR
jgi:glutamyl-tRNA(Gln) amidotransferase subunit E